MDDHKLSLKWKEGATVLLVNIVHRELRTGQDMSKSTIVPNKNEVLLVSRKEFWVRLSVFPMCSKHEIPDRHEESIVRSEVSVVTKVKLGCVEQVSHGGPFACENRITDTNVHVTKGIDNIENYQVCPNHRPMLSSSNEER